MLIDKVGIESFLFEFAFFGFQTCFSNLQISNLSLVTKCAIIEEKDYN